MKDFFFFSAIIWVPFLVGFVRKFLPKGAVQAACPHIMVLIFFIVLYLAYWL